MKILHLSLKKGPFEIMSKGDKKMEFRKRSKWIMSRLLNKDGSLRHYDVVQFVNGYSKDAPRFQVEYKGFEYEDQVREYKYNKGPVIKTSPGDIIIKLGAIVTEKIV